MSLAAYADKRFLIVDPLDSFRFTTKQSLTSIGIRHIDTVANAQSAIARLESSHYDVVLCNYDLGKGKNGQALLEELRHKKLLGLSDSFFIISAEVERSKVLGTLENMPDGYLVKPITPVDLENRIGKALAQKQEFVDIDKAVDQGRFDKALELCSERIAKKDANFSQLCKTKAWILKKIKRWDDVIAFYQELFKEHNFLWAKFGIAEVYVEQENLDGAEETLIEITESEPEHIESLDLLAQVYKLKGDLSKAQTALEQAIHISPNSLQRQHLLADVAKQNGNEAEAIEAFKKVVKLSGQSVHASPKLFFEFAELMVDKALATEGYQGDIAAAEAFDLIQKANKRFSSDDQIKYQSGLMEAKLNARLGNSDKAAKQFDTILAGDESKLDSETIHLAAETCHDLGREDEAKALETRAIEVEKLEKQNEFIEITPEDRFEAGQKNKRSIELAEQGDLEQAIKEIKAALPLMPRHISLNLNLIQLLIKLQKRSPSSETADQIEVLMTKMRSLPEDHREHARYIYLREKWDKLSTAMS